MAKLARALHPLPVPTRSGEFTAWYSESGLAGITFPGQKTDTVAAAGEVPPHARIWHCATRKAVALVLEGKAPASLPPLDLSGGTEFQQAVWRVLAAIEPGKTMSYAEVADAVGRPAASRAVGQACGANPVPVLVPCHRVLASNSRIGGFAGGTEWKRRLLSNEGVRV